MRWQFVWSPNTLKWICLFACVCLICVFTYAMARLVSYSVTLMKISKQNEFTRMERKASAIYLRLLCMMKRRMSLQSNKLIVWRRVLFCWVQKLDFKTHYSTFVWWQEFSWIKALKAWVAEGFQWTNKLLSYNEYEIMLFVFISI